MGMPLKFGMFVHWGIYSLTGYHEQVRWRYFTPRETYARLAERFNPTEYDPDKWVALAKSAGMEYICFTTKHHDGFCMFDTKYTDFNIMHTPYGHDVLRELADACERGGIRLSLYYSNPDWNCPFAYNSKSSHQFPSAATSRTPCVTANTRKTRFASCSRITARYTRSSGTYPRASPTRR